MFQTLVQAFKQKDLRKKLLLTLGILLIYRIGCWLPIPGLNPETFASNPPERLIVPESVRLIVAFS